MQYYITYHKLHDNSKKGGMMIRGSFTLNRFNCGHGFANKVRAGVTVIEVFAYAFLNTPQSQVTEMAVGWGKTAG